MKQIAILAFAGLLSAPLLAEGNLGETTTNHNIEVAEDNFSFDVSFSDVNGHEDKILGDRYGLFCIINKLNTAKKFKIKIGTNGSWTSYTVNSGSHRWFSHKYDRINENRSPKTWIKFDSDMNSGEIFTTEYKVSRYSSPSQGCDNAKKYEFQYDGGGTRYVDLYSVN